jgi:hypothetical protein
MFDEDSFDAGKPSIRLRFDFGHGSEEVCLCLLHCAQILLQSCDGSCAFPCTSSILRIAFSNCPLLDFRAFPMLLSSGVGDSVVAEPMQF